MTCHELQGLSQQNMDRQIIFERVGGAGSDTCGINKQVLVIALSLAR